MDKKKLAVIEDDEDTREFVLAFFRSKNFATDGYADASSFLESMALAKPLPDVIISDLNLPCIDGVELVRQLQERGCDTPVLLLTAENSSETAIRAIEAGAYDFLVKPLSFPQLQVAVDRALHFSGMRAENASLKAAMSIAEPTHGIIGKSFGLRRTIDLAKRVANSSANVFISGETGTGKEVIAKAIHHFSTRAKAPFIAINCSAIPENLLESELFGHAKGSFTGAVEKRIGLFEEAGDGSLFLDEIGDLSLPLQAKLLRVLQDRKIRRIGETQQRSIRARIISATHKDLRKEVSEKRFREDLFFRLNVIPMHLSPLRERREDIIPLAEFFLKKFSVVNHKKIAGIDKDAMEFLLRASWPGNVRELENAVERAIVLAEAEQLSIADFTWSEEKASVAAKEIVGPAISLESTDHLNDFIVPSSETLPTLEEVTNRYVSYAVARNGGVKDKTARDLGIDRKTLYRKLHCLQHPEQPESRCS